MAVASCPLQQAGTHTPRQPSFTTKAHARTCTTALATTTGSASLDTLPLSPVRMDCSVRRMMCTPRVSSNSKK